MKNDGKWLCFNEQERAVDLFWVAAETEEQSREEGDIS